MKNKIIELLDWFREKPRFHILFYLGLFSLILPLIHYQAYANDLWKALYSGRYLALNWSFPSHAEFTFSPVVEFVVRDSYNWLGNLVFFGLHRIGGIPALQIVLRMGLVFFAVILTHSIIKYKLNPLVLLMLFFLVVNIYQKSRLRTAIFIIPFLIAFWWLWNQAREKGKWHLLWGFPVLFLFWGNMHGSYLKGFCFLLIVFAGDVIDKFIDENHPGWPWLGRLALVILGVFLIITFVKPFPDYQAAELLVKPLQLQSTGLIEIEEPSTSEEKAEIAADSKEPGDEEEISEKEEKSLDLYESTKRFIQNLFIDDAYERRLPGEFSFPADSLTSLYVLPSFLIIAITLSTFIINYRAITAREFLVWLAAAFLGSAFMRTVPVISLVMIPLLFIKADRGDFANLKFGSRGQIVALVSCLLVATNLWYLTWNENLARATGSSRHRFGFGKHPRFSNAVVTYALENYAGQKGYNNYNQGTYLIWKWWPEKKVFIDSKSSAYASEFMKEYRNNYGYCLIQDYELDHAILSRRDAMAYFTLIPHPEWEIIALDESFILLEKVEEALTKSPSEYLLLSPEEFNQLDNLEKQRLQNVMNFIEANQNKKDSIGKYRSPGDWLREQWLEQTESQEQS